jgi:hypothetical protein
MGELSELDDALARFSLNALEYAGGLANHGPMVVEALSRLGHGSLITGFVDVYAPRLPPLQRGAVIPPAARDAALGDVARMPDWVSTFEDEMDRSPWTEVLGRWLPPLLPGLFAGAAHGLLRVAHAVRALDQDDTAVRRRDLGLGLAYWAARYQELPGVPGRAAEAGFGPAACFAELRVVPHELRAPGFFFSAVEVLGDQEELRRDFVAVVERFDPASADPDALVHEICRCAAELYLANPHARIAYVHCLTAPSALRLLAPRLDTNTLQRAVGFALQAVLALHAVSAGEAQSEVTPEVERLAVDEAELRYRAACSLEEHAIKFVEACLREHAIQPAPVFRLAAADAATRLDSGAGRGAAC